MTRILWLSDLHYMRTGTINGHDPRIRIQAAMDMIARDFADADAVVVTGDLTEAGLDSDYATLAQSFARLPMPVFSLVGNHDNREAMARHLPPPEGAMDGFRQFIHDLGDLVLVALDSADGVDAPGKLCAARLDWLRGVLSAYAGRRVLVAVHHPPVPLNLPNQDPDHLRQGGTVLDLLAQHGRAEHLLCGHVHRSVQMVVDGVLVSAGRSVAYQAPALRPLWTWDDFNPEREAPTMGVLDVTEHGTTLHQHQICPFEHGVSAD